MLDYQKRDLQEAREGLDATETAMKEERWSDALTALMTVQWAVTALQDKMPRPPTSASTGDIFGGLG